ncbi:MAG TPA: hypothetical protein VFF27_12900 [Bacteroidia bacterium]|jgi:hypothetical protein|nr:hypothetical protein [Bacteroidia bacterium]
MKKTAIILFVLIGLAGFSQVKPKLIPMDSIKKYHYIYLDVKDFTSNTTTTEISTGKSNTTTTRHVNIYYQIGTDGREMTLGKKNEELVKRLQTDEEAYAEYQNAMKHKHKFKVCYRYELLGYLGILGGGALAVWGLIKNENDGDGLPIMIAGGAVGVAGLADITIFHFKAERHLDKYGESIRNAIKIYNEHLLAKVK